MWERLRGNSKSYDPQLDWKAKIDDMRQEWESVQSARGPKESENQTDGHGMPDDGEFSSEIHAYFKRSSPKAPVVSRGIFSEKIPDDESGTTK